MLFTVHFTVTVSEPLHADEYVFVTGNVSQLGSWDPKNAVRLSKTDDGHWTGTVSTGVDTIKFRYFIGYYLEADVGRPPSLIISKWETHLTPRCVMPAVEASKSRICRANVNDVFGFNGGRGMLSDGWLLNAEQNQILITIQGQALKFYKGKHVRDAYRLKVLPMDLRHREDPQGNELDEEADDATAEEPKPTLPSFSRAQIAPLTKDQPRYRHQDENGELFENGKDYFMYRTNSVAVEYLGFRIEVYAADKPEQLIAFGHALPSSLQDTFGRTSVPLLSVKGIPIGKVSFGYLFVRPLALDAPEQKMNVSYAKHWKKRIALEVGHRGLGNSYTKLAMARENTLHSLNEAGKKGSDYVEFDVHLTKDKVPVIFHDFQVLVSVAKRTPSIDDLSAPTAAAAQNGKAGVEEHELAVKDLKFSQLRLLHLDHVKHEKSNENDQQYYRVTADHDEAEEHRPFPTLNGAFNFVSEEVGFNIEIKYPMEWIDGQHECANYFERNEFVDIILAEVLKNAGTRRVVFSSFDPDVCIMLTQKQNKYPVLFLCQGQTEKHMDYVDLRTRTSDMAVRFAAGAGLAGVNLHSEDLLKNPEPIALARHFGLITFVWGDELADKEIVTKFKKEYHVDGVIYDRIGEGEHRSNVFLLERAKKQALFGKPPSPQSSRHKSFTSNIEVNSVPLADRLPVTSAAAIAHLDLPVSNAITTNSRMQVPSHFSSASTYSSTSSGISSDSATALTAVTTTTTTPTIRRQHYSFSQGYQQALSIAREL